jgi:hypothetical protein
MLDHFVILFPKQLPIDHLSQYRSQIGVFVCVLAKWEAQLLLVEVLQSRHELKAQQFAEGKANLALPMSIHITLIYLLFCTVPQDPLDHRSDFRGRRGFELGINTQGVFGDM